MIKRLVAIAFIYACCCIAWAILGGAVVHRTETSGSALRGAVGELWGGPQVQHAPTASRLSTRPRTLTRQEMPASPGARPRVVTDTIVEEVRTPVPLAASRLRADLDLEHRRKGLVWFPTYRVAFDGRYRLTNEGAAAGRFAVALPLPEGASVFSDVALHVDGEPVPAEVDGGALEAVVELAAGESAEVRVGYGSQGIGTWRYAFGPGGGEERYGEGAGPVRTARDVALVVTTDAAGVDFPPGTLSPTGRTRDGGRSVFTWDYGTLVASADLGVAMPQKLNPGPWVSRVTFFAPVSLFLFFFAVFTLSVLRGVRLHPMHYFFLGAACFAFHLLLAYLVDQVTVGTAMLIASVVSVGLVVSYVRLVAGLRFAVVEVGGAQVVYLVGFAATFFLDGFTGLALTVLSVATLFGVMQATGRIDWEARMARPDDAPRRAPVAA